MAARVNRKSRKKANWRTVRMGGSKWPDGILARFNLRGHFSSPKATRMDLNFQLASFFEQLWTRILAAAGF
jgi:hypothetical protein